LSETLEGRLAAEPAARLRLPRRFPYWLVHPAVLLALVVAVHVGSRVAALCVPYKIDSMQYAVSAYRLWQPGAVQADLVPDKPPGQALLTGWCFRFADGEPSLLTLVPIESAFLLAGYAVFFVLTCRLFGRRSAGALTLFAVVAQNTYTVLEITSDGFNLNENYLALPINLAVLAHLTIRRPATRGLVRGVAIGLALTIKQTAVGLLAVLLVHGLIRTARRRDSSSAFVSGGWTLIGAMAGMAPAVIFLWAHGWLAGHVADLAHLSGGHLTLPFRTPGWNDLRPVLPILWWLVLGCAVLPWSGRGETRSAGRSVDDRSVALFAFLWLVVELLILSSMVKPSTHYYQPIVVPGCLLAGCAITTVARRLAGAGVRERLRAWRWIGATTGVLLLLSAMPLLAEARKRAHTFDARAEVRAFAERIEDRPRAGGVESPSEVDRAQP
jgi:hypothetical protein